MVTTASEPQPLSQAALDRVSSVLCEIMSRNPARSGVPFAAGRDTEVTPSSAPARTFSAPTAPQRAQRTAAKRGRVTTIQPVPAAAQSGGQ